MVKEHTLYDLHLLKFTVTCFMGSGMDCLSKCIASCEGTKLVSVHAYVSVN